MSRLRADEVIQILKQIPQKWPINREDGNLTVADLINVLTKYTESHPDHLTNIVEIGIVHNITTDGEYVVLRGEDEKKATEM